MRFLYSKIDKRRFINYRYPHSPTHQSVRSRSYSWRLRRSDSYEEIACAEHISGQQKEQYAEKLRIPLTSFLG